MADQNITTLPEKTAPATGDKFLGIGTAEEYLIDYDKLADAVLGKLTSKTYALDQGTKSLVAALNELNSKTLVSFGESTGAGLHNSLFRGKNLGTSFTSAQSATITAGTFNDLFVGDYWVLNNIRYRIAGFDIFLRTGDVELTKHHVVIVPDEILYQAQMNETDTTVGGYYYSKMKQENLTQALATVSTDFGLTHILTRRALLDNTVISNDPSAWNWYDTQIDLMNEMQVYGGLIWGQATHNGYYIGCDHSRFPLFNIAPNFITVRGKWYWLRTVRSSAGFAGVAYTGYADAGGSSVSYGVRPYFLVA